MSHGKVVLDFRMPPKAKGEEYGEKDQEAIKLKMDKEFSELDPNFKERLRWKNLIDLPAPVNGRITTRIIRLYLKAEIIRYLASEPPLESGTTSTTYCYSGDQRICYHAFTLIDTKENKDWIIRVTLQSGEIVPITPLIVLSYDTHLNPDEQSGKAQQGVTAG